MVSRPHRWILLACASTLLPIARAQNSSTQTGNTQASPEPLNVLSTALQREARLQLEGSVIETIRFPARATATQLRSELPAPPPLNFKFIAANFQATLTPGEPIAGRQTLKITLIPTNKNASSWIFWVDRGWNLRLGVKEIDAKGVVTTIARYERVQGPPVARTKVRTLTMLERHPALERRLFTELDTLALPDGFFITGLARRAIDETDALVIRASNGLSVLLIVLAPHADAEREKTVVRRRGGLWVWVVANLPRSALNAVAQSVPARPDIATLLTQLVSEPTVR